MRNPELELRRVRERAVIGGLCLVCLAFTGRLAAEQEIAFNKWAVVGSKDVQQTGLSDLLTAKVSGLEGVQFVEREQLEAAVRELELSALFGSEAASQRLRLGRLLKADALVLLSMETRNKQETLRLVISETTYGARLYVGSYAYDSDRLDELAAECRSQIEATRQRFQHGIKHLVGVTQFLSKNLTHDYDHLQTGYPGLLESALTAYPGVAVLEIEEAQAISRELMTGGGKLDAKVSPAFIEGEFKVAPAAAPDMPTVALSIRVRDADGVRHEWRRDGAPLDDVPGLLLDSLPAEIVKLSQDERAAPLSRQQQQRLLAARADAFARLALWRQSTSLREAALLLDPGDIETRMALVVDYNLWLGDRKHEFESEFDRRLLMARRLRPELEAYRKKIAEVNERRLAHLRLQAHHIRLLVGRRLLNLREAAVLTLGACQTMLQVMSVPSLDEDRQIKTAVEEFFWSAAREFPHLDCTLRGGLLHPALRRIVTYGHLSQPLVVLATRHKEESSRAEQVGRFAQLAGIFIRNELARSIKWEWNGSYFESQQSGYDDRHTLDRIDRLLKEATPPAIPLTFMAYMTVSAGGTGFVHMVQQGRLSSDQVRAFYQRLKQSGQPLNVFYARCGLLALEVYVDKQAAREALEEADALLDWINSSRYSKSRGPGRVFLVHLTSMRAQIARMLENAVAKSHKLPANPIPPYDPQPRVRFAPLEGLPGDALELTKCTESLDLIRSLDAIYVVPSRGLIRKVFESRAIHAAVWDGESIWIATAADGVYVVSPEGRVLGRIGAAQGLPAYDSRHHLAPYHISPVWLHAIEGGRCIAVATLPDSPRVWFAELFRDKKTGAYRSKTFHTATKVPPGRDSNRPDDDPREIFRPAFLLPYSDPEQGRELLLVGRTVGGFTTERRPLAIDVKSLEVSVFPAAISYLGLRTVEQGRIVCVRGFGITQVSPPVKEGGEWQVSVIQPLAPFELYQPAGCLFRYHGALVNGGAVWRRLDPKTLKADLLTPTPISMQYHFERYACSAHYGLVAWNQGDQFYRVSIDGDPPVDNSLAARYPFFPAEVRERHESAVKAIRRLGGHVDVAFRRVHGTYPQLLRAEWSTLVYLSEDWRGSDADLALLGNLQNLYTLQLVRADVTDEGFRHIGRLTTLERLEVVETKATNKALAEISHLKRLQRLRLEGPAGGDQFNDDALKHLAGLAELNWLELYGHGFTDKGIEHLKQLPKLEHLSLFDTKMTKDRLNRLKQSRAGFYWREFVQTGIYGSTNGAEKEEGKTAPETAPTNK